MGFEAPDFQAMQDQVEDLDRDFDTQNTNRNTPESGELNPRRVIQRLEKQHSNIQDFLDDPDITRENREKLESLENQLSTFIG